MNVLKWILLLFVLIRLVSLALYPLGDTSEARYGEVVRLMVESRDWVTPWFDYNVPFLGKPPLVFWASSLSVLIFGDHELSYRLPSLLFTLAAAWMLASMARSLIDKHSAWLAALIYLTSAGSLVLSGAVILDPALSFCVVLSMLGFTKYLSHGEKKWAWLIFVGFGLGMLTKGPIAIIFSGTPMLVWLLANNQWRMAISFPWLSSLGIFCAIWIPWYVLMELANPDFLHYFFVGEHYLRFVDPGWSGDKFGSAHQQPRGMIWFFMLVVGFPWVFFLPLLLKGHHQLKLSQHYLMLWVWMLVPLIFFSFSRNILWTYALPSLAPMSILVASVLGSWRSGSLMRVLQGIALFCVLALSVLVTRSISGDLKSSDRDLLSHLPKVDMQYVVYYKQRPFSGRFYSQGQAQLVSGKEALWQTIDAGDLKYLVIKQRHLREIEEDLANFEVVATENKKQVLRLKQSYWQ